MAGGLRDGDRDTGRGRRQRLSQVTFLWSLALGISDAHRWGTDELLKEGL